MNVRLNRVARGITCAALIISCGDSVAPPEPVASVELSAASLTLGPGEIGALTAVARSASGAVLHDRTVSWNSSDILVATVDGSGRVTGRRFGGATISATIDGESAGSSVTVTATEPTHLAGAWRMRSFDGKDLPATYAYFPNEPVDGGIMDVDIRLDSAKLTLRDDGIYSFRQYCFTELHGAVPRFRYCWGDHGRFFLGNPPGRIAFVSEYIQNLSASGTVTAGGLLLTEPLWISEEPRNTVWASTP